VYGGGEPGVHIQRDTTTRRVDAPFWLHAYYRNFFCDDLESRAIQVYEA
jgi:hypothetical protein